MTYKELVQFIKANPDFDDTDVTVFIEGEMYKCTEIVFCKDTNTEDTLENQPILLVGHPNWM